MCLSMYSIKYLEHAHIHTSQAMMSAHTHANITRNDGTRTYVRTPQAMMSVYTYAHDKSCLYTHRHTP